MIKKEIRPDLTVDVRYHIYPVSILKVQAALKQLKVGEVVEILCGDEQTRNGLILIVQKSARQRLVRLSDKKNYCKFYLCRKS